MPKRPYSYGLERLANLQARLGKPPKRKLVPGLVDRLVQLSGMKGQPGERYFRLLATCALRNMEPRFRNWKPVQRRTK